MRHPAPESNAIRAPRDRSEARLSALRPHRRGPQGPAAADFGRFERRFNADVGVELPPPIELRPVPNDVAARVPQTKDYRYAVADNRVLLVSPVGQFVVGVFMDDVQAPRAGEGRRTP